MTDFGRQDVGSAPDFESLKRDLASFIQAELNKDKLDAHVIYSSIKEKIGSGNTDDTMLNFAINSAINQIEKAKDSGKPLSDVDLKKQVDLVVGWALIKVKGKDDSEIGAIGAGKNDDIDYGTGGDTIALKDFITK